MSAPTALRPRFGVLDSESATLVDLIAYDWLADPDYYRFVSALKIVVSDGYVSMNDMRRELSNSHGLTIEPHRYSGFYRRACRDGCLSWDETDRHCFDVNDDRRGRNTGKPQRRYLLASRAGDE